jgi:hypothetical protein
LCCVLSLVFFVLCDMCCQFLWIVLFLFSPRYALTFISTLAIISYNLLSRMCVLSYIYTVYISYLLIIYNKISVVWLAIISQDLYFSNVIVEIVNLISTINTSIIEWPFSISWFINFITDVGSHWGLACLPDAMHYNVSP